MAAADVYSPGIPIAEPSNFQPFRESPVRSRQRRMNFFDMANLLDSDGNLQNEMLVFAFAATMLSTIPVLLGNEFDVNVGLRRKRDLSQEPEDPSESSYVSYMAADDDYTPTFFSNYTYKRIMTTQKGSTKDGFHVHSDSSDSSVPGEVFIDGALTDEALGHLLRDLLDWSQDKTKNKPLLAMLINLGLDKYHGHSNPADKLVKTAYKKWKNFHW